MISSIISITSASVILASGCAPTWQQLSADHTLNTCSLPLSGDMAFEIRLDDRAESIVAGRGVAAWVLPGFNQFKPSASFVPSFGQRHHADRAERSGRRVAAPLKRRQRMKDLWPLSVTRSRRPTTSASL